MPSVIPTQYHPLPVEGPGGAAFGVYRKQRASPSSPETKAGAQAAAKFASEMIFPQDAVDVGLMALPAGGALRKLGAALIAGGAATEAEAGALNRLLKRGASLLKIPSKDEALAALKASQEELVRRYQPMLEDLHAHYSREDSPIADKIEHLYDDLERTVDLDAANRAYAQGYNLPGTRASFSGDVGVRSPKIWTPGLHFASAGNEAQLGPIVEKYFNPTTLGSSRLQPQMRPVLARSERAIQLPDLSFEDPKILAADTGLIEKLHGFKTPYNSPGYGDVGALRENAPLSKLITDLLEKEGVDLGVYLNEVEGDLGPGNVSYTSFGKKKLKGFAQGGLAQLKECSCHG